MLYHTLSLFALTFLWLSSLGYAQSLQWKQVGLQRISSIGSNSRVMVLVDTESGISRSEDSGRTWKRVPILSRFCQITNIVNQGEYLFLALNDATSAGLGKDEQGIYRSIDNGKTWQRLQTDNIQYLAASDSIIVATSSNEVLLSFNAGNSWERVSQRINLSSSPVIHPSMPNGQWSFPLTSTNHRLVGKTLFICGTFGLERIRVESSVTPILIRDTILKEYIVTSIEYIRRPSPYYSTLHVRADTRTNTGRIGTSYVISSIDNGMTWRRLPIELPPAITSKVIVDSALQVPSALFRIEEKLMLHIEGQEWSSRWFAPVTTFYGPMSITPFDNLWYTFNPISNILWEDFMSIATSSPRMMFAKDSLIFIEALGLHRIDFTSQYQQESFLTQPSYSRNTSGTYSEISYIGRPPSTILQLLSVGDTLFASTPMGIFQSLNNGIDWKLLGYMNDNFVYQSKSLGARNLIIRQFLEFHKSSFYTLWYGDSRGNPIVDGSNLIKLPLSGSAWEHISPFSLQYAQDVSAIGSFGNNLLIGYHLQIYYSSDEGKTWRFAASLPNNGIRTFAHNSRRLFAGTDNLLYFSDDSGKTWQSRSPTINETRIIATRGENLVFIGTPYGVWRSKDNGETWSPVTLGLPGRNILSIITTDKLVWVVVKDKGVFVSTNDGDTWQKTSASERTTILHKHRNQIFAIVSSLEQLTAIRYIYTTSPPSEIFVSDIPQLDASQTTPITSKIAPNPAESIATITFDVEEDTQVSLKIHDVLGRVMAILVDEQLPIGQYSKSWQLSNIPTGVYFYHILIGSRTSSGKILVAR